MPLGVWVFLALAAVGLGALEVASRRHQATVRGLVDAHVTSIRLDNESVSNPAVVELTEEQRTRFLQLLASADRMSPNHPRGRWTCLVTIVAPEETVSFRVHATHNNGTLAWLFSGGTSGWNYGTLRADALGPLVEAAFARHFGRALQPDSLLPSGS